MDVESVLKEIAKLARERRPLAQGLSESGLQGADSVVTALKAGQTLDQALTQVLGSEHLELLRMERLDLEQLALLISEDLALKRERRALILKTFAYPAFLLILAVLILIVAPIFSPLPLDWRWAIPLAPILLVIVTLPLLPWISPRFSAQFPLFCGWHRHWHRAGRFRRAAVAADWRLPESELTALFGRDLSDLAPFLADQDASSGCQNLATYHQVASRRGLERLLIGICLGVYVFLGALLLMPLAGAAGHYRELVEQQLGVEHP